MNGYGNVGAAIVGTGFMATAHTDALRRLGVQVRGIVGRTPERGDTAARRLGLPRAYRSLAEVLEDRSVQAVHIVTPNSLHAQQVMQALEAGKHVICEKPLAPSSEEASALVDMSLHADTVTAVCLNVRYYPQCIHARDLIARGRIGTVRMVTGRYHQDWLARATDWNWRLEPDQQGRLRAVADIGVHWLDLVQTWLDDRIDSVFADLYTFLPKRRRPTATMETFRHVRDEEVSGVEVDVHSDDAAALLARFRNGARAVATFSQVSYGNKNCIEVQVDGSESSLTWRSEEPEYLWLGHRGQPNELVTKDYDLLSDLATKKARYPVGHVEGYPDTFVSLFGDVYDDILRGGRSAQPRYPTFTDGYDLVLICEAIEESARVGRWVPVRRSDETRTADSSVSQFNSFRNR
ncbi:Gfo/Idh/MocA family protein [Acidothermus cellulolyticus]|nr:Gfo/Idh/MocA family oxidoreductase [Acidothermus cellulolyticus]